MHECYGMQSQKNKEKKTPKKEGHKEKGDEAQGP